MKAIQTHYNGYKFRSRLEARWAVFFETLGIKWIYEPEGYILKNGEYYLPDFFLPEIKSSFLDDNVRGLFAEVKADNKSNDDKFNAFSTETVIPVLMLGNVPYPPSGDLYSGRNFNWVHNKSKSDGEYYFCECLLCGEIGIEFDGRSARIPCGCKKDSDKDYNFDSPRLLKAYKKARQARFEHGETP